MIKVAITGPESCGKSTLAEALSKHFKVALIPEYSRTYLEENGPEYDQTDLDEIAEQHLINIDLSQESIKIVDTDFVVLKVWSEYKYDFTSGLINEFASENHFDLHILCSPDTPWEEDPLRENPDDRHKLFEMYLDTLNAFKKDYIIVSGEHKVRLKKSIESIELL